MSSARDEAVVDGASLSRTLFTGAHQRRNFGRIPELFTTSTLTASTTPHRFPIGDPIVLPDTFRYDDHDHSVSRFISETETAALVVLRGGVLRHEWYGPFASARTPWLSMSVAKSFVSTLVGLAMRDGHIDSLDEPVNVYAPQVEGSAYDGVSLRNVLQMSSGAAWNEDYADSQSDVRRLGRAFQGTGTLADLVAGVQPEVTPGTRLQYNSAETQVLGFVVAGATGESLTSYMQRTLWEPLGMEQPAHWVLDPAGVELAFAGMAATALDYAKLGELFRQRGVWNGEPLVPEEWARAAVTPDAPHLQPGVDPEFDLGYGYQWWIPDGDDGEFAAIGVYNQFVYVNPSADVTIVKLSANPRYGMVDDEAHNREMASIAFFRALAAVC